MKYKIGDYVIHSKVGIALIIEIYTSGANNYLLKYYNQRTKSFDSWAAIDKYIKKKLTPLEVLFYDIII